MSSSSANSLTLFEFWSAGHVSNYLQLVLEYWQAHGNGQLTAVVTARLVSLSPSLLALQDKPDSKVRFRVIDPDDEALLDTARQGNDIAAGTGKHLPMGFGQSGLYFYWGLVEKYAARYPARHFLLMHLDEYLYALAAGKPAPGDMSGILLLPDVAYPTKGTGPAAQFRRFTALQRARLIERMLSHPQLRTVFFLDPSTAQRWAGTGASKVVRLADPVSAAVRAFSEEEIVATRVRFGVPPDRRLLLFFGAIAPRKGIWNLLAAFEKLADEDCRRACLAIVGHAEEAIENMLAPQLQELSRKKPLSVIRHNVFVDSAELHAWFAASDVVLAPYIQHTGVSGVLLNAAIHSRPVLSQDYGQMGRMVRDHGLGMTVDTEDAQALVDALGTIIRQSEVPGFDSRTALALAREQTPDRFAENIFREILPLLHGAA